VSYNDDVIAEFRASGGKVGGHWEGRTLLLLTTSGRKSGQQYTTPMVYTLDDGRLLVYGSNGGSHAHPDWYLNLVADPNVTVEVGTDRYEARAVALQSAERDRLWAEHTARWPHFADYQVSAGERTIPIVAITRR
jgi:deazaflavin-dependent oxidoreductase (nitroreductase family)